jgi:hypothetical protein
MMDARILDYMQKYKFKKLVMCNDTDSGLRAIIAIHSTALGPATGGLRMWTYEREEDAIFDALRLARGMTYKYAAAGVNLGGGKAVIIGNPKTQKTEALMRAMGRFIDQLNGEYITLAKTSAPPLTTWRCSTAKPTMWSRCPCTPGALATSPLPRRWARCWPLVRARSACGAHLRWRGAPLPCKG